MLHFTLAPHFWMGLWRIILVNVLLSGDNAVVIALACRNLSDRYRNPAVLGGTAGAVIVLAPEPAPVRVRSFAIDTCST